MISKRTNLIIGNVDSGKTRGIMFPEIEKLIQEEKNFFIIDNKEEYYPKFKNELEKKGYKVCLINLRNPLNSNAINILEYPFHLYKNEEKDQAINQINAIAQNICIDRTNTSDLFWENNAADYLASLILILFENGTEEEINFMSLGNLINILDDKSKEEKLKNYFQNLDVNSIIYKLGSTTIFAPIDTRGGILSTLKYKINTFFNREEILKTLSISEFSISSFTNKFAFFFEGKNELNAVANVLIEQFVAKKSTQDNELAIILDNINSLPAILEINELIEYASLNHLQNYFITNNLNELKEKYGKYTFEKVANILKLEEPIVIDVNKEENSVNYPQRVNTPITTIDLNKILNT